MLTPLSIVYAILNAADLIVTLFIINQCNDNIEGNPIASFCYHQGGAVGMATLKALMTSLVIYIAFYIYNKKPHYSFFLIGLGCLILALTIGYSLHLGLFYNEPL